MNAISKILGLIAALGMLIGLIPLLGWLNWIVLVIAGLGLVIGALSRSSTGMIFNGIILIVSLIRLVAGGGVI